MAETGSIYEAYYKLHPDDLILCFIFKNARMGRCRRGPEDHNETIKESVLEVSSFQCLYCASQSRIDSSDVMSARSLRDWLAQERQWKDGTEHGPQFLLKLHSDRGAGGQGRNELSCYPNFFTMIFFHYETFSFTFDFFQDYIFSP